MQESLDLYNNTPKSALKRKHEPPEKTKDGTKQEFRNKYNHYNHQNGLLDMNSISNEALVRFLKFLKLRH